LLVIDDLAERLKRFRDERDWARFHTPKDLAISISVEAAELLELFQWKPADESLDEQGKEAAASEVADIFLYLVMFSERLGIDLLEAARRKLEANEARFPVDRSFGVAKPPKD
jgi:NTP pyrophosphatase (non-canonical NTP hydrolase)